MIYAAACLLLVFIVAVTVVIVSATIKALHDQWSNNNKKENS